MNDVAGDDQISPAAIHRCDWCHVKNFAIGGRNSEKQFVPAYVADSAMKLELPSKLGKRAWCGVNAPEVFLRLVRIICTPMKVNGEIQNLCQRCTRKALIEKARDAEEAAA